MSQSEDQAKSLKEFFKSLGEVDEESRKWKEYHESAAKILRLMFEFLGDKQEFVKARLYGSTAENLKNYSFDDVGDFDLLLCLGGGHSCRREPVGIFTYQSSICEDKRRWASAVAVMARGRHRIRMRYRFKGLESIC